MREEITFRVIEQRLRIVIEEMHLQESLGSWYQSVRDKLISDFEIEDVCKACRQRLYLEFVVPEAIKRLHRDPLAGEKFDGELFVALRSVAKEYWVQNVREANDVRALLLSMPDVECADLQDDIRALSDSLPSV